MITSPLYCHETYRTVKRNTIVQFGLGIHRRKIICGISSLLRFAFAVVQISGEFEGRERERLEKIRRWFEKLINHVDPGSSLRCHVSIFSGQRIRELERVYLRRRVE